MKKIFDDIIVWTGKFIYSIRFNGNIKNLTN